MSEATTKRILITQSDLNICSKAVEFRFQDRATEAARMQVMRELLAAASSLERAVRCHTHAALVNHAGTCGSMDFPAVTETFFNAMFQYAAIIRDVANRFGNDSRIQQALATTEVQ